MSATRDMSTAEPLMQKPPLRVKSSATDVLCAGVGWGGETAWQQWPGCHYEWWGSRGFR